MEEGERAGAWAGKIMADADRLSWFLDHPFVKRLIGLLVFFVVIGGGWYLENLRKDQQRLATKEAVELLRQSVVEDMNNLWQKVRANANVASAAKTAAELLNQRIDLSTSDRYTATDARRDRNALIERFDRLEGDIERNERDISEQRNHRP